MEEYSPPSSYHGNMKKKKNNKNKRRFTNEQIKLMETIFESESKLEPRKKLQVAKELGLHPRQVAIWFQNKRARWKSKQVEQDYNILKASYDNLAYKFQSLKEETQSLLTQLHKLKDQVEKPRDLPDNCIDGGSDRRDIKNESEVKPGMLLMGTDARTITSSTDGDNNSFEYLDHKEFDLMNVAEHADGVLTSPENWCSLDSSDLFDQSCSSSQWWEFWP